MLARVLKDSIRGAQWCLLGLQRVLEEALEKGNLGVSAVHQNDGKGTWRHYKVTQRCYDA